MLDKLAFEVSQVETAIVIGRELVRNVKHNFVAVLLRDKVLSKESANLKDLIIAAHKLIKLERSHRVD
jgi:hypothetical protein